MLERSSKSTLEGVHGDRSWGPDRMPMEGYINLCEGTIWDKKGYTIEPFLSETDYQQFYAGVRQLYIDALSDLGVVVPEDFRLEDYHKYVKDEKIHLGVVERVQQIPTSRFPIDKSKVIDRVSEICKKKLSNFNPITREEVFNFRTTRPMRPDYNPIHRDTWHPEYESCVNIYVGIAGSNRYSSLPVEPGSHYWNENDIEWTTNGAFFNGVQFTVPGVTDCKHEISLFRPNPKRNEVLVFSPYSIHGGASNRNTDMTRISLEMRFWLEER